MSFFDRFKKKEETPVKKDEPKENVKPAEKDGSKEVKPVKEESKEDTNVKIKERDDAGAASKDKPVEKTKEKPRMAEDKKKADGKVWHITKRTDDGMWQVKAEGASKATKLFKTKAEAEDYVKTLVSNNEGSRVVKHKKTGEFQNK